jgi:predicted HD superfamily hydrolase involved in NAD metabolism
MRDYDRVVNKLQNEIDKRYSGKPLARHIRSVAEFAREIAAAYAGKDSGLARKAFVAGLAHDLYKKFPKDQLRRIIREENVPIDEHSWKIGGSLLHASPAAHYLREQCGVTDDDVLGAVYHHTTGRPGAGMLDKIIYCADYLDPSREVRTSEPDVEELSARIKKDLDAVYREILARKLSYTVQRGNPLHPNGLAAWNEALGIE